MPTRLLLLLLPCAALAPFAGCARQPPAAAAAAPRRHEHHPPHGGTPVVLGDEAYHLELVRDPGAGVLQVFILDGEMENFIRAAMPSFTIEATVGGETRRLTLQAVPDPATGETVGDTALFSAEAEWLRTAGSFDGVVKSVTIRGSTFTDVAFNFPQGNDHD